MNINAAASSSTAAGRGSTAERTDLWSDILKGADRSRGSGSWTRRNILLLSERHHGRRHLLDQLSASSSSTSRRKVAKVKGKAPGGTLALGYEVLEVREEGDEDSAPPVSIFYPPSSHPSLLRLVPSSLPPSSFQDTAVMIVLDWTKPSSMVRELLTWLAWVDNWAKGAAGRGEAEELRERLQSHLQHYAEPQVSTPGTTPIPSITSVYGGGPLLPLGPGSLTLNHSGIPIVVVCTRADLMDAVGDEMGMKGGGWEERTDWVQQALRTVCLAYGASLFYTTPIQPSTYALLRQYLLHRLHTIPPPLNPPTSSSTTNVPPNTERTRFPFNHRANVLDRDAVMVPSGWDSWGKINVLREGFDPGRVGKAWEVGLSRVGVAEDDMDDEEDIEDLWVGVIPDTERGSKPKTAPTITTTTELEQSFLLKQFDIRQKDPQRDPRASFRNAAAAVASSSSSIAPGLGEMIGGGVVGPMGSGGGGLSLPGVEKAMAEMEGGSAEDMKEKFARLGRRESSRGSSGPLSPTTPGIPGTPSAVPNEALHNFFQGLLATKAKSSSSTPAPNTTVKTSVPPPPIPTGHSTSPRPPDV